MPLNLCLRACAILILAAAALSAAVAQTPDRSPAPGTPIASTPTPPAPAPDTLPTVKITNPQRTSILITSLSLDLHLTPATASLDTHATLTLRNTSATPLTRIPLQLSSTLRWQSISAVTPHGIEPIPFTQSPIATDTDHTGYAQEAILTPTQPLAPGQSLTLSAFYSGVIKQNADRLEFIGTTPARAAALDWDQIAPTSDSASTALRGFGNVLWYPVAAPAAILGQANDVSAAIARERIQNLSTSIRLRLTVDYAGEPPDAAIFNGRLQPLLKTPDSDLQPIEEGHGLATADFPSALIGFRTPSLFLTAQPATYSDNGLLTLITPSPEAAPTYPSAAAQVQPLLTQWLGPSPLQPVLILDHPGAPFADATLLVTPLDPSASNDALAPTLVAPLTHAWLSPPAYTPPPAALWLDQGLPEFISLLYTERTATTTPDRATALAQLAQINSPLALAEPDLTANPQAPGQPLISATSELYLRLKSAAVLWQLRNLTGDAPFREALLAWRQTIIDHPSLTRDPNTFQHLLEASSNQSLDWFFTDWVTHDRGLPDLTLVQAVPHPLPARPGKSAGFLIAVEVRNDGDAIADVPIIVHALTTSLTQRLRIPAHASNSIRILFEETPESIQVNDGSVPEQRTSTHLLQLHP